jgi:hypothetical protein
LLLIVSELLQIGVRALAREWAGQRDGRRRVDAGQPLMHEGVGAAEEYCIMKAIRQLVLHEDAHDTPKMLLRDLEHQLRDVTRMRIEL